MGKYRDKGFNCLKNVLHASQQVLQSAEHAVPFYWIWSSSRARCACGQQSTHFLGVGSCPLSCSSHATTCLSLPSMSGKRRPPKWWDLITYIVWDSPLPQMNFWVDNIQEICSDAHTRCPDQAKNVNVNINMNTETVYCDIMVAFWSMFLGGSWM